jgi:hypothetical protein
MRSELLNVGLICWTPFETYPCWAPSLDGCAAFARMSLVQKQVRLVRTDRALGRKSSKRVQRGELDVQTPGAIRTAHPHLQQRIGGYDPIGSS